MQSLIFIYHMYFMEENMNTKIAIIGLLLLALIFSFVPFTTEDMSVRYIFFSLSHVSLSAAVFGYVYLCYKNESLNLFTLTVASMKTPVRFYTLLGFLLLFSFKQAYAAYISMVIYLTG